MDTLKKTYSVFVFLKHIYTYLEYLLSPDLSSSFSHVSLCVYARFCDSKSLIHFYFVLLFDFLFYFKV